MADGHRAERPEMRGYLKVVEHHPLVVEQPEEQRPKTLGVGQQQKVLHHHAAIDEPIRHRPSISGLPQTLSLIHI